MGDKLLPVLLSALGETPAAAIDNLIRAEQLGLLPSAEQWMAIRSLRNQMVHEYIEDPHLLSSALHSGHAFVPVLIEVGHRMLVEMEQRGWRG
jgi:hypothetical protein